MKRQYWILIIALIIFAGCSGKAKYKRVLPFDLKLTANTNEEKLRESGNYVELFFNEEDYPLKGFAYKDHKKYIHLNFGNYGKLASMKIKRFEPFDQTLTIKYLYNDDNRLDKVRTFVKDVLIFEQIFYYDSNNTVSRIENVSHESIDDTVSRTSRYFVEFEYHDDHIVEEHGDDLKTKRKTYFMENKNVVIYYDPIFAALYRPYQQKDMQACKYELFHNGEFIKLVEYDIFGNVKEKK